MFEKIIKKILENKNEKVNKLKKLIEDTKKLFDENKEILFLIILAYIITCIFSYFITGLSITISYMYANKTCFFVADILGMFNKYGTKPFTKIVKMLFLIATEILNILSKSFKSTKNECSGEDRDEEKKNKSPERFIDSTEGELNCMKNRMNKFLMIGKGGRSFRSAAELASESLNNDQEKPSIFVYNQWEKLKKEYHINDKKNYCPNPHELRKHNNKGQ